MHAVAFTCVARMIVCWCVGCMEPPIRIAALWLIAQAHSPGAAVPCDESMADQGGALAHAGCACALLSAETGTTAPQTHRKVWPNDRLRGYGNLRSEHAAALFVEDFEHLRVGCCLVEAEDKGAAGRPDLLRLGEVARLQQSLRAIVRGSKRRRRQRRCGVHCCVRHWDDPVMFCTLCLGQVAEGCNMGVTRATLITLVKRIDGAYL